jgi:hypothetical protein
MKNQKVLMASLFGALSATGASNLDSLRIRPKLSYAGLSKNSPSHAQQKRNAKKRKNIKHNKF